MTVYTDTQSARVLFDPDGEGLDFTDLNDLQKLAKQNAQTLIAMGIPNAVEPGVGFAGLNYSSEGLSENIRGGFPTNGSDLILAPRAGAGYFIPGGTARKLVLRPGPIMQIIADAFSVGSTSEAIATFWLRDDNVNGPVTFTTDVGDTDPRIDLIECKLEYVDSDLTSRDFEDAVTREATTQTTNKRRRVQATIQIKKGTPSASAVVYPTPDAGFAPIMAVYIPALHNAVHDAHNIRDLRMPVARITVIDQRLAHMDGSGATAWTRSDVLDSYEAPASGSGSIYFPCPITSKTARVVGVGCFGVFGGSGTFAQHLVREYLTAGSWTYTKLGNFDVDPTLHIVDTPEEYLERGMCEMMDCREGTDPDAQGGRAPNTRVGNPYWCNGCLNGPAVEFGEPSRLALKFTAPAGSRIRFVRWFIAE